MNVKEGLRQGAKLQTTGNIQEQGARLDELD